MSDIETPLNSSDVLDGEILDVTIIDEEGERNPLPVNSDTAWRSPK